VALDRARTPDLIDDLHDRRRVVDIAASLVKFDRDAALLHYPIQLRQEIDVEIAAAKLPIGNAAQAQILLVLHDLADRAVLDLAQRGGRDGTPRGLRARVEQKFRAQEAADVIGTERRPRRAERLRL
jgi:hypothetical protein